MAVLFRLWRRVPRTNQPANSLLYITIHPTSPFSTEKQTAAIVSIVNFNLTKMAKQCVVVQEAVTVPNYQPPRGTRGVAPPAFKNTFLSPIEKPNRVTPNTWLDTMRASSPTHSNSPLVSSAPNCHSNSSGGGGSSLIWMMQHPSALNMFNEIINAAEGKQIVMFLDYDGTLSPIVDDPDKAFMSKPMRETVRGLAKCFPTAIVSGRNRLKVYDFVQLAELYYAGSHGMDIKGPVKRINLTKTKANGIQFQPASKYLPMIDQVYGKLVEKTKYIPGSSVEHNKFCVSVHFRRVDEELWSTLAEQVRSVLKEYPKLKVSQGRKVLEIRPMIKWDKGRALEFLLESLGFDDCNNVLPVYIGDDCTDEDAFKVLKRRGQGLGILVSKFPKDTNATYTLQEPSEVMEFLQRLVDWKRLTVNGFC